eukprot:1142261-Pelagomonas_calceolata.AAC.1
MAPAGELCNVDGTCVDAANDEVCQPCCCSGSYTEGKARELRQARQHGALMLALSFPRVPFALSSGHPCVQADLQGWPVQRGA